MDGFIAERIRATQEILAKPEIKEIISKHKDFWMDIQNKGINIVYMIQPVWNKRNKISATESEKLCLMLLAYRLQGLDMEYFTSGAGASYGDGEGSCIVM